MTDARVFNENAEVLRQGTPDARVFNENVEVLVQPPASQTVSPGSIASGGAMGTPTVTVAPPAISPAGIASGAAFGSPTVTLGPVTISPTSIAGGEVFGIPGVIVVEPVPPINSSSPVVLSVTLSLYITHTYRSDLTINLSHPDGTGISLINSEGGDGSDFGTSVDFPLTLDDSAADPISSIGTGPVSGPYRPEIPLSTFDGKPADGVWVLSVIDNADGDVGVIVRAMLRVTTAVGDVIVDLTPALDIPDNTGVPALLDMGVTTDPGDGADGYGDITWPDIGLIPDRRALPGYFRIRLTTLHYPGEAGVSTRRAAHTLTIVEDFEGASVGIPINDQREGQVTVAITPEIVKHIKPGKVQLHMVYVTPHGAHLPFWGILTQPKWNLAGGKVTMYAVDHSIRMQHRQVRYGTQILNPSDWHDKPNPYNNPGIRRSVGNVPLDAVGIKMLFEAGQVPDTVLSEGVPPLGIRLGVDHSSHLPVNTDHKVGLQRGAQLWDSLKSLSEHIIMPDFELQPYDREYGIYALLNIYQQQGQARPNVIYQDGFGLDNADIQYTPGGKLINIAHTLSDGDKERVTVEDHPSMREYGIYAEWIATNLLAKNTVALKARGDQMLSAYAQPPDYVTIAPHIDSNIHYGDDYLIGDTVTAAFRVTPDEAGDPGVEAIEGENVLAKTVLVDIVKVTLVQADSAGNVQEQIEVQLVVNDVTVTGDESG